MTKAWRVTIFMILILIVGFSIMTSTDQFADATDKGSLVHKIKHADVYVGDMFNKGLDIIN